MTSDEQMAQGTPEQAQAGMEGWMSWVGQAGDAIVALGTPLAVVEAGGDSGDPIGGYAICQAKSQEVLAKAFEGHPHFGDGSIGLLHQDACTAVAVRDLGASVRFDGGPCEAR
jgi:hypothetical protein